MIGLVTLDTLCLVSDFHSSRRFLFEQKDLSIRKEDLFYHEVATC